MFTFKHGKIRLFYPLSFKVVFPAVPLTVLGHIYFSRRTINFLGNSTTNSLGLKDFPKASV